MQSRMYMYERETSVQRMMRELLWLKKSLCVEGESKEGERLREEGCGIGRETLKT